MRVYDDEGNDVGSIRKYVGVTALSMGSDPAYAAHRTVDGSSAVFDNRASARAYVLEEIGGPRGQSNQESTR